MKKLLLAICLSTGVAFGQVEPAGGTSVFDKELPQDSEREFQFIAYWYSQAVSSNYYPTNDFLKGQVIGRLFGQNTTQTSAENTSLYVEQRLLPFFIYQPKLFNGRAILRASFEIDFTWGDVAYGTGGNFGGAVSADQVNIQTQNVELEFIPFKNWTINLGLQRMFDNPYNPYRTLFDYQTQTGYRLMYWGTDASGITARYQGDYNRWKFGAWKFYENQVQENDDVSMYEVMYERDITQNWRWGGSVNYVRDRANGEGGPSILGQGLNSTLSEYNGTFRFPLGGNPYRADIFWLGSFWSRNVNYTSDRFMTTGFVKYNLGSVDTLVANDNYAQRASIGGLAVNLHGGYRYGITKGDVLTVDFLYTAGDGNGINDNHYSGVMTGNNWGSPVSVWISHGAYILFPHGNVVNRFVAAVNDVSNLGYGLTGGTVNLYHDIIPNKLNAKIGAASAISNVAPPNGGFLMGVEANGRLSWTPKVYMNLELHAAYMWLGDFYDSGRVNGGNAERPVNPWTVFLGYKWLMF
ncbi:MAG: hypothetical protein EP346_03930 [Bacteroidetes bacterium]|nr:MAG: hypothetical protein EP346_03930 [Bacteroidota bacterium]